MKIHAFIILFLTALTLPITNADPQLYSWMRESSGQYARLYESTADETAANAVSIWSRGQGTQTLPTYAGIHEVSHTPDWVYIRSTGLGAHTMGPWYLNAAKTNIFPNYPANMEVLWRFPRTPTVPTTKSLTGLGAIGYFVDGVAMFDSRDAFSYDNSAGQDEEPNSGAGVVGDDIWNRDAYINENVTFDAGNAHQAGAQYHYHANPAALRHLLGDSVDYDAVTNTYSENFNGNHSPILGWARDGHPIYGPYGYANPNDANSAVTRMLSSYQMRDGSNGTTNLAVTGRTTLPGWAITAQGIGPALATDQYGPAVNATYILGHYIEDYDYLGSGHLDQYNGRTCVTPDYPGGTYAYFVAIEADGTPTYPYNIGRQFYGDPTGGAANGIPHSSDLSGAVTTEFEGGPEVADKPGSLTIDEPSGDVTITWNGVEGGHYVVDYSPSLGTWTTASGTIIADSRMPSAVDSGIATSQTRQFYQMRRIGLEPFDDAGFDYDGGGPPPTGLFSATFPTTPPLPPQNAVTSITVGGVTATIVSYDQATGAVELDFDDSSLAPGSYNAILNFSPGGTPTQVLSTNQFVVSAQAPNNILLMIVDDWAIDSSPIDNNATLNPGTTFPTMANLQALASQGVRFTNGYTQPVCSPMRATIITGRQAWRTGVGTPGDPLLASETTLPEAFAAASSPYALASFGKWHLGGGNTGYSTLGGWPEFIGITGGAVPNNSNGYYSWPKNDNGTVTTGFTTYSTTDQVNEASSFIQNQETAGNPWFVWLAFNAPHTPYHEPPTSLLQGGTGTTDRDLYEKALEALDTEIGRLFSEMTPEVVAKTNIILVGDNGTPGAVVQAPYSNGHAKGVIYEGGIHVPFVVKGPDVALTPGTTNDRFVHVIDLFPTILELAGITPSATGVDATSLVPILNGTDTAKRTVVTETFSDPATASSGDGRSIRMEADPAFPGSHPDYKLLIFGHPFDTADTPQHELYNVATDQNEQTNLLAPANLPLSTEAQNAYDALLAKDATLDGGYNDPPIGNFDTLYIQLPSSGVTPPVPNLTNPSGGAVNVNSVTVDGNPATYVARVDSGTLLADEGDDAANQYWVKVTVAAAGSYTTAHVVFPNTPMGAAREYDSISISVKP